MFRLDLSFQFVVAANKVDLVNGDTTGKSKPSQENMSLVRKHWRCPYIECSARSNYNISLVFRTVTQLVINQANGINYFSENEKTNCCPFASNLFNCNSD